MVTKEKQMLKKGTKLVILFKAIKYIILLSVAHKLVFYQCIINKTLFIKQN